MPIWKVGAWWTGFNFAFVIGLTVGYDDLVPHQRLPRLLALGIGFSGILLTALIAAIGVRAMPVATEQSKS